MHLKSTAAVRENDRSQKEALLQSENCEYDQVVFRYLCSCCRSVRNMVEASPSSQNKNVFDLSIAGVPYRVKTSHDAETVQNLVDLVNAKINEALRGTKNGSYQGAAVLAAIHLAEELLQFKKRAHQDLKVLEDKLLRLAVDLEKSKLGKISASPGGPNPSADSLK